MSGKLEQKCNIKEKKKQEKTIIIGIMGKSRKTDKTEIRLLIFMNIQYSGQKFMQSFRTVVPINF